MITTILNSIWEVLTEIAKAKQSLNIIKNEGGATNKEELEKLNSEVAELEKLLEQGRSDYDRKKQVLDNLRRSLRKIDDVQDAAEFPKTEEELKNAFYRLEETFKKKLESIAIVNFMRVTLNLYSDALKITI